MFWILVRLLPLLLEPSMVSILEIRRHFRYRWHVNVSTFGLKVSPREMVRRQSYGAVPSY